MPRGSFQVVVPTRNRPEKLGRCLSALAVARTVRPFDVLVCDSSDEQRRAAVLAVAEQYPFVTLVRHRGRNVAAARNACAQAATADVLVNVDDDIQVEPDAVATIVVDQARAPAVSVVAGAVAWSGSYSSPVVMRFIGYGRPARDGETPSFVLGAFFAYPRSLALTLPWNERIRTSDDRFMGALWRSHGVHLGYSPHARATHDPEHVVYDVSHQASHIYVNLFDAVLANRDLKRALAYEIFGFVAGARVHCRTPRNAKRYVAAWLAGHGALVRDRRYLRQLLARELPQESL
jgi:glycosyltransferase involved in cell wall biosynthesis